MKTKLDAVSNNSNNTYYSGNVLSVALFDWDGTVSPDFTLVPWIRFLCARNLLTKESIESIEYLFLSYEQHRIRYKELADETALAYAQGLAGIRLRAISKAATEFVCSNQHPIYSYAPNLFRNFRALHITNIVVSGAPAELLRAYAKQHFIDHVYGVELEVDSRGIFTGVVTNNPGSAEEKAHIVDSLDRSAKVLFAFGNNLADLPLLSVAQVGIVLNNNARTFPANIRERLTYCTPDNVDEVIHGILQRRRKNAWTFSGT